MQYADLSFVLVTDSDSDSADSLPAAPEKPKFGIQEDVIQAVAEELQRRYIVLQFCLWAIIARCIFFFFGISLDFVENVKYR